MIKKLFPLVLIFTWSCATVGPDYSQPNLNAPDKWNAKLEDGLTGQNIKTEQLAKWWQQLNDPILNDLIDSALQNNLDLALAKARIREARAKYGMSEAGLYPTLDASGSYTKSQTSENKSGVRTTSELYSVGFDAGWEIDIFGGTRRDIEAAQTDVQAQEASLLNTLVSLTGEVAQSYVELRTYQTRFNVAEANLESQEKTYELTTSRFDAGLSDQLAVQQAKYNLASTRSSLPTLRSGMVAAQNRLAVLLGQNPGSLEDKLTSSAAIPVTPLSVAVGIPAETLRQRPDIRQAERELAAQTARIGVATADLYPKFKLAGSIGLGSLEANDLLDISDSGLWSFGPSISWRIFDAGYIRRNIKVQSILQEQYLIKYESVVLSALEEVENALTKYAQEQLKRQELKLAVDAAQKAEELAREKYKAGLVDFSNVLEAQRYLLSFQDQLASSEGTVTTNLVSLYKALGGGWQSFAFSSSPETADQ